MNLLIGTKKRAKAETFSSSCCVIPITILTDKNTTSATIIGLKSGAIEYIQKPFNIYELLLKVNNIIGAKERVLSKYKAEIADGIATALIYFNNPVGIGEHPQFLTELDKIITKISNAEENLKTITKHFDK